MELFEFDICGQICPSALLTALREVNAHAEALRCGQCQIVIRTDARDAIRSIPAAVTNMGYKVDVEKSQAFYQIRIYKG